MNLIVYYSRSNNTKKVAESIQEKYDAKIIEIKDKKNRSGPIGYLKGAIESVIGKDTSIEYEKINLKDYDTIFIGSPVWASKPAPAVIKYIKENEFSGTNCVSFATMSSSGGSTTTNIINNMIISQGGNVKNSFAIAFKKNNVDELISQAINDLE